jgi:hypothetical protein
MASIDGATDELPSRELNYFFTFRKKNRPAVSGQPATSAGCINGLWYYSASGSGGSSAVPGFKWDGITVGANAVTVLSGGTKSGERGTLGETTLTLPRTITFYGTAIADKSVEAAGYSYHFTDTKTITVVGADEVPKKVPVTLDVNVPSKSFGPLVAHVWRHELRHAEQFERLARAGAGDANDRDGDQVYNLQEMANNTDSTLDKTWNFPISTKTAKGDQEVDCELRALPEQGAPANDWAMDTRKEKKDNIRLGTQWTE